MGGMITTSHVYSACYEIDITKGMQYIWQGVSFYP